MLGSLHYGGMASWCISQSPAQVFPHVWARLQDTWTLLLPSLTLFLAWLQGPIPLCTLYYIPVRATSKVKSKDLSLTPPNWKLYNLWRCLEMVSIKVMNRIQNRVQLLPSFIPKMYEFQFENSPCQNILSSWFVSSRPHYFTTFHYFLIKPYLLLFLPISVKSENSPCDIFLRWLWCPAAQRVMSILWTENNITVQAVSASCWSDRLIRKWKQMWKSAVWTSGTRLTRFNCSALQCHWVQNLSDHLHIP